MSFKTFTSATLSSSDVNTYLMKQAVIGCTSSTRPTGVEGMTIYETDTDKLLTYTGATWSSIGPVSGALTSWTPAVTQTGSVTVTVNNATYTRTGRWIEGYCYLTVTGSGTGSSNVTVSIPVTAVSTTSTCVGTMTLFDTSAGTWYHGGLILNSSTTVKAMPNAGTNALGSSSFTAGLAAGDVVTMTFAYEASADT